MDKEIQDLLAEHLTSGPSVGFEERVLYRLSIEQKKQKPSRSADSSFLLILYILSLFSGFGLWLLGSVEVVHIILCIILLPIAIVLINRITDTTAQHHTSHL